MDAKFADQQSDSTTIFHPFPGDLFAGISSMLGQTEPLVWHYSDCKTTNRSLGAFQHRHREGLHPGLGSAHTA